MMAEGGGRAPGREYMARLALRVHRKNAGEPLWIEESRHESRSAILALLREIRRSLETGGGGMIEYFSSDGMQLITDLNGFDSVRLFEIEDITETVPI
jgi:hypothetical protein